jgi:hypothetical protein
MRRRFLETEVAKLYDRGRDTNPDENTTVCAVGVRFFDFLDRKNHSITRANQLSREFHHESRPA